jgi:Tol biopolymer transport system component
MKIKGYIMKSKTITSKIGPLKLIIIGVALCVLAVGAHAYLAGQSPSLKDKTLTNESAYLPAQCYIKTAMPNGVVYNSCYVCHCRGKQPNVLDDSDLQSEAGFPAYASTNHFENSLTDRSDLIQSISDEEILQYIRTSNYFNPSGEIILAGKLTNVPPDWDYNGDGQWEGFVPDCYFNFDNEGFDRDKAGNITGWRAYSYYLLPATYFPSGGSSDDVMIRLPEIFRTNELGQEDLEIYTINLAIMESLIKRQNIKLSSAVNETRYQVDLDKDGQLGMADTVVFDWAPLEGRFMSYVGKAKVAWQAGQTQLAAGLYPKDTEFLRTIRYQDIQDGDIVFSERMKEVRYFRKKSYLNYAEIEDSILNEIKDRSDFPDRLRQPMGNPEVGIYNGMGWVMQGFIEDAKGDLRPQSFEETVACIGCHGGVGATTDSTYSFSRKLDHRAPQAGWAHWSQRNYQKGMNEPKAEFKNAGLQYEYTFYLMYAGGGDDFRSNPEVKSRFFGVNGLLRDDMAEALHDDVSLLLYPSPERAMQLNKTYKTIVGEQSFVLGRDTIVGTNDNIHDFVDFEEEITGVVEPVNLTVDAREFTTAESQTVVHEQSPDWMETIHGLGMGGPGGQQYQIDWHGFIHKSDYALQQQEGVYFRFPPRQTLPARMIVPLGQIPVCYQCHRIPTTVPDRNPQVTVPVPFAKATYKETGLQITQLTNDAGRDGNAQFSPNGNYILYESQANGEVQLWRMDPDGSNKQQITDGPKNAWARFSHDGQRLTYWQYNEGSGIHRIINNNIDGTDEIVIDESFEPLDRPDWSPDGSYITYAALKDGNWDIWVAEADGSGKYRITSDPRMETNPLWKPQGMAIAFKMAPTTGTYNLTEQYFMTFENGFENPTVHEWNGVQSIQMYDWSPDGTMVAYTAEVVTPASGEDRVSYAAVVEPITLGDDQVQNGKPVLLAGRTTLGDRGPVFSPDSRKVAFWAWDKNYRATIWISDVDGTNLKQLTTVGLDMAPKWSPDGSKIVFESTRSGNQDVWIIEL